MFFVLQEDFPHESAGCLDGGQESCNVPQRDDRDEIGRGHRTRGKAPEVDEPGPIDSLEPDSEITRRVDCR